MTNATRFQPLLMIAGIALVSLLAAHAPAAAAPAAPQQDTYYDDGSPFPTALDAEELAYLSQLPVPATPAVPFPDGVANGFSSTWAEPGINLGPQWEPPTYGNNTWSTRVNGRPYLSAGYGAFSDKEYDPMTPIQMTRHPRRGGHPYRRAGYMAPWSAGIFYRNPW